MTRVRFWHPTLLALCVLATLVLTTSAYGQVTWDGCTDILGTPVPSVRTPGLNDIARATITNSGPVILYNPAALLMRPQTKLWIYGHECGHHAMGHALQGLQLGQEQEADCFGVVTLVSVGALSDNDVSLIQHDLANFGPGDWTHLPGPQRAINLRACLNAYRSVQTQVACIHPLHAFDLVPCSHIVMTPFGPRPLHQADQVPCSHPAHPNGHIIWQIAPV